jgi:hypothetical protein
MAGDLLPDLALKVQERSWMSVRRVRSPASSTTGAFAPEKESPSTAGWSPGFGGVMVSEARVPEKAIPHPWEVPMPMAQSWSFVPNDSYKSPRVLIHMLADGGSPEPFPTPAEGNALPDV